MFYGREGGSNNNNYYIIFYAKSATREGEGVFGTLVVATAAAVAVLVERAAAVAISVERTLR
jgi:hypothetical protein